HQYRSKSRNHEESTSRFSHAARIHGLRPLRRCVRLAWLRVLRLWRRPRLRLCWLRLWLRLSPDLRRLRLGLSSILARGLGGAGGGALLGTVMVTAIARSTPATAGVIVHTGAAAGVTVAGVIAVAGAVA